MRPTTKFITIPSYVRLPGWFYTKHSYLSGPIRTPLEVAVDDIELALRDEIPELTMFETILYNGVWQPSVILTIDNFNMRYSEICDENGVPFIGEIYTEAAPVSATVYSSQEEQIPAGVETPVVTETPVTENEVVEIATIVETPAEGTETPVVTETPEDEVVVVEGTIETPAEGTDTAEVEVAAKVEAKTPYKSSKR